MRVVNNIKEIMNNNSLKLNNKDFKSNIESLKQSFKELKKLRKDGENGVSLVLGSIELSDAEKLQKALKILDINIKLDKQEDKYTVCNSYNAVISSLWSNSINVNNDFNTSLMTPCEYSEFKIKNKIIDINIFTKKLYISNEILIPLFIVLLHNEKFENNKKLIKCLDNYDKYDTEKMNSTLFRVGYIIDKITESNKILVNNSSKTLEILDNFKTSINNKTYSIEEQVSKAKELKEVINNSKRTYAIITSFKADVLQNLLDEISHITCGGILSKQYDHFSIKGISSVYISSNYKDVITDKEGNNEFHLVLKSNDLMLNKSYNAKNLSIISTKNLKDLKEINIINLNNISYDKEKLGLYISLLGEAHELKNVQNLNLCKVFTTIDFNIDLNKILNQLKNKETDNNEFNNKQILEMKNGLKEICNSFEILIQTCLKLDSTRINKNNINLEKDIIALPLCKIHPKLLKKLISFNSTIEVNRNINKNGDRVLKRNEIAVISNTIYKNINNKVQYDCAKLKNPLLVQNTVGTDLYEHAKNSILSDIERDKLNTFFMLMLIVYNGNILLQIWDREYFVKQIEKENIKYLKYIKKSSNGIPYRDNINGKLIENLGLASNLKSSKEEEYSRCLSKLLKDILVIHNKYNTENPRETMIQINNNIEKVLNSTNKSLQSYSYILSNNKLCKELTDRLDMLNIVL